MYDLCYLLNRKRNWTCLSSWCTNDASTHPFFLLQSGGVKLNRRGVIMLTFWPSVGERKYDWEKRQVMCLYSSLLLLSTTIMIGNKFRSSFVPEKLFTSCMLRDSRKCYSYGFFSIYEIKEEGYCGNIHWCLACKDWRWATYSFSSSIVPPNQQSSIPSNEFWNKLNLNLHISTDIRFSRIFFFKEVPVSLILFKAVKFLFLFDGIWADS